MAATTIHLTLTGIALALVAFASIVTLVSLLVTRLLGSLTPQELAAVTMRDRVLLVLLVLFLAVGPLYLIHLVTTTGGTCS